MGLGTVRRPEMSSHRAGMRRLASDLGQAALCPASTAGSVGVHSLQPKQRETCSGSGGCHWQHFPENPKSKEFLI